MNGVLLDTSFLITFADAGRRHHEVARHYFRECVHRRIPMYLSTIAISEFQVRQSINDLPLRNFIVLPFNVDHAMSCGALIANQQRDEGDDRVRVKDDFKLIAQCVCEDITHLLSEDAGTLVKYLERSQPNRSLATRAILLKAGFDASWFNDGQHAIPI